MKFSLKTNIKEFTQQLREDFEDKVQQLGSELGQAGVVLIQRRAGEGIGLDDEPMPQLSAVYRSAKERSGRKGTRNLTYTGAMLRDIVADPPERTSTGLIVRIRFATAQQRLKAAANQARAAWFGLSPSDRQKLLQLGQARLAAIMRGQS